MPPNVGGATKQVGGPLESGSGRVQVGGKGGQEECAGEALGGEKKDAPVLGSIAPVYGGNGPVVALPSPLLQFHAMKGGKEASFVVVPVGDFPRTEVKREG